MRIAYIAVSYRTGREATTFAGYFSKVGDNHRVLLVDNTDGPDHGKLEKSLTNPPAAVRCITAGKNFGYLGGVRFGFAQPWIRDFNPQWLVISNVDVQFDPIELANVLDSVDANTTGIVAPNITCPGIGPLNPFMKLRPSRARMHFYKVCFAPYLGFVCFQLLHRLKAKLRGPRAGKGPLETANIYAPHGAFVILSNVLAYRNGVFDHGPFLYGEELTLAERARDADLAVRFQPAINVMHTGRASTSSLPSKTYHAFVRDAAKYVAEAYF